MRGSHQSGKLYTWGGGRASMVHDQDAIDQADPEEQAQQLAVIMIDALPNRVVERFVQSIGGDMEAVFTMAERALVKQGGWRGRRALTDKQAAAVIRSGRPAKELAEELGVSPGLIWRIRREAK